jgi:hypothetical protein
MKRLGSKEDLHLKLDSDMVGDWHSSHKVLTLPVEMAVEGTNNWRSRVELRAYFP